jgi:hypothetical protein
MSAGENATLREGEIARCVAEADEGSGMLGIAT